MRAEPATSPSRPFTTPFQAPPSGQAAGVAPGRGPAQGQDRAPGQVPTLPPSPPSPPSPPADLQVPPGTKGPGPRRRWLFAGLAVLAALAATVVVLLNIPGGNNGPGPAGPGATDVAGDRAGTGASDVGRRITTGSFVEDPQLIVPRTPACGLTSYQNVTPAKGRFCTVPLTMINAGGETVQLGDSTAITLIDDRGVAHSPERVSTILPAALPPGTKADALLVFDLPLPRKPAKLTGVMIQGGRNIEVRLS